MRDLKDFADLKELSLVMLQQAGIIILISQLGKLRNKLLFKGRARS